MSVYEIDPIYDPRWPEFLQRNPRASVFHTAGWLNALKRTHGYDVLAYTTSPPRAELDNGWVFCRIRSWLTGRRLVSLPFSDHCDPLVEKPEHLQEVSRVLRWERDEHRWKYVEYRPLSSDSVINGFGSSETFCFHKLELQPDLDRLFRGLHRDSIQRKIKRAEREGLACEEGCSELLLDQFYHLLVMTRRRHQLPPQPRKWFSNLISCMGEQLKIRVAFFQGVPTASILTLRFKNTLMYKYGCADERFFRLGGMQMLLWRAIKEAKESGLREFDLGRSDSDNQGLIVFKDRFGAERTALRYFRYPVGQQDVASATRPAGRGNRLYSYLPGGLFAKAGKLLYRHFG